MKEKRMIKDDEEKEARAALQHLEDYAQRAQRWRKRIPE